MTALAVFDQLKADIQLMLEPARAIRVINDDMSKVAMSAASEVKKLSKAIEEKRKDLVGPLNDEVKRINGYAKQISEPLLEIESHLKRELAAWNEILAERRREEMRKAEEAKRLAEAEAERKRKEAEEEAKLSAMFSPADDASAARAEVKIQTDAVKELATIESSHKAQVKEIASMKVPGARTIWNFEVTDASAVPMEFLMVNEKALREAVRAGVREIPGVRIFSETVVAIGAK